MTKEGSDSMFTWICPTCGREVPPAYDACPDCAAKAKSGEQAPASPPPPPPPSAAEPAYRLPAVAPLPPPPPPVVAAPHMALPTWLLTILFAFAFLGLGAGVYWLVQH